jgi:hypothetical protein
MEQRTNEKKIRAIIGGIISNDDSRVDQLVRELTESVVAGMESKITKTLTESFRGETNV